MPQPLVTIAIPCFNAQNTIERAIESAQNQDWPNIEILVVDDGSEDESGAIIEALAKKDKRIRLMCHELNQGLSVARNTAIGDANGEFIAFFDADDVSYPERINLQYQRLTNYEREKGVDLILCYAGVRIILAKGRSFEKKGIGHRPPEPFGRAFFDFFFAAQPPKQFVRGFVGGCVYFARKTTFEKIGLFDPALRRAEDTDHDIRAALKGAHFISPDAVLADYVETTASHKTRKEDRKYLVAFGKKYRYMFQNGYVHYLTIKRLVAFTGLAQAREKRKPLLVIWYRGWSLFWLFMISPRLFLRPKTRIRETFNKARNILRPFTRIRKARHRLENAFKNKPGHKAPLTSRKAGK